MAFVTDNIQILGKLEENALATTKWVTREELGCLGQCAQEPAVKVTNHRPFFLAYHPACFLVTICRMGDHVEPRHHSPSHCLCVSVLYCVTSTEIHSKTTSPGSCSHILKEVLIQHKYSVDD